jgi:hypothetical protein
MKAFLTAILIFLGFMHPQLVSPAAITPASNTATSSFEIGIRTKSSSCVANEVLPDLDCTPGAILSTSTAEICTPGYAAKVRKVPDSEKKEVFAEYGIDYGLRGQYEVDHLISLELGGSNDMANLWPELNAVANGAFVKDKLENYLHRQVCAGKISLQQAQYEISTNWVRYYLTPYP